MKNKIIFTTLFLICGVVHAGKNDLALIKPFIDSRPGIIVYSIKESRWKDSYLLETSQGYFTYNQKNNQAINGWPYNLEVSKDIKTLPANRNSHQDKNKYALIALQSLNQLGGMAQNIYKSYQVTNPTNAVIYKHKGSIEKGVLIFFESPSCSFCQRLKSEIDSLNNIGYSVMIIPFDKMGYWKDKKSYANDNQITKDVAVKHIEDITNLNKNIVKAMCSKDIKAALNDVYSTEVYGGKYNESCYEKGVVDIANNYNLMAAISTGEGALDLKISMSFNKSTYNGPQVPLILGDNGLAYIYTDGGADKINNLYQNISDIKMKLQEDDGE
ncbi:MULTISPECIES: hypothetical protein [Cysteiniphilum]|uniref:Thioredoxin-like fold domain-containing protein n=1 Tax=Cysteiniphilum litorale TaxID=2056700 RepID=A0A8J3E8B4_9GAMM|nr:MULTISPECIES: hypothetical protein [Cysteiniphilum]GGF92069.1 hypothetical protein GCM10010995_06540 [Cysteiniphilum litorale]